MRNFTSLWMLIGLTMASCANSDKLILEKTKYEPIQIEHIAGDTLNKYHILVPSELAKYEKVPMLLILDAHGDGKMAVEKFFHAVQYFPCVVIGSDLIENNFIGYEQAISEIITDTKAKYPIDPNKILISGFSGGARMAYNYSLHHQVNGVLMCGAGPGKQLPACPVYAISGMGDFNFSENYVSPSMEAFNDSKFTADYFFGNHEWPQSSQLSDGLIYLLSFRNTKINELRNMRSNQLLETADSLARSGNSWMAWIALLKAAKLSESSKIEKEAADHAEELLSDEKFLKTINSLEKDLKTEAALQKAYAQKSMTESFNWWQNELNVLNDNLEKYKSGMQADHYLRIKGFIGILLYSRVNKMIYQDSSNPQLPVLIQTYIYAEPENSYAYYFQALYDFQKGNNKNCIESLNKSLNLGFSDTEKLKQDFPNNILNEIE